MRAVDVAEKYSVSRAWVHRLQQRRRETGSVAPRRPIRRRISVLTPLLGRLEQLIQEQPDRTLSDLKRALNTPASLATIWRTVNQLGFKMKKDGTRARAGSSRARRH
jgi:transposase